MIVNSVVSCGISCVVFSLQLIKYYVYTCYYLHTLVSLLFTESSGLLEAEEGTYSSHITQTTVRRAVDITSAAKGFDLKLQFGSYK